MRARTTCNRDCPDACGILATVVDGRVTKLQGDPDHPVTQGFLCYRTSRFLERQYDPQRITTPLVRRGEGFEPLAWEAAFDLIAATLQRVRAESGPAAILNYRSGGSLGLLKLLTDYFFERFGPVTLKSGDICSGAGEAAQELDFGECDSHDLFDLRQSRSVVLWGKNPFVSNVHLLPLLREARGRGARVIQIDPVRHRGADLADLYLQPRPGGDIALAYGVARRLFDDGGVDAQATEYCDHLDALRERCGMRSVADWAALADVSVDGIDSVAAALADRPAAILVGWGMQRRTHGSAAVRMLDALGAISGNLGIPGGGVSFYFKRRGAFDTSFIRGLAAAPRAIPDPLLGPGILAARDPQIRFVWISNANPVAMLPESDTVARALASREMTVVVDSFMTDSARAAHLVLPTTTMLEDDDVVGAFGHHWLGGVRPVVPPPPGVRSDLEIIQALAARVGLGDELAGSAREWQRRLLRRVEPQGVDVERLDREAARNPEAPPVLFAERRFATSSGRVNLVHDAEPEPPRPTAERPLLLMALSTERAQGSQWRAERQEGAAQATLHPAAASGFAEGETVRLESELGWIPVVLRFDARQRRDVVLMDKGGWHARRRAANALVPARATDAGGGAVYHDTAVRLLALDAAPRSD